MLVNPCHAKYSIYTTLLPILYIDYLQQSSCKHAFSNQVRNSVDPDQMASSEASWYGYTLFFFLKKKDKFKFSCIRVNTFLPSLYLVNLQHSSFKQAFSNRVWNSIDLYQIASSEASWSGSTACFFLKRINPGAKALKYKKDIINLVNLRVFVYCFLLFASFTMLVPLIWMYLCRKAIKSKWVWSGNTTITHYRPTYGTGWKNHSPHTVTRHTKDNKSKAASSLFLVKTIAKLERYKVILSKTKTNTEPPQTMGGT